MINNSNITDNILLLSIKNTKTKVPNLGDHDNSKNTDGRLFPFSS